ncbi:hemerythrin domain-containing protein [Sporomusa sp.]|uniref:hemerythrin domain-containing protein n=1 Tax=Sporomusa sp. TaxID=2078658 RepID=UPI002B6189B9|nr:hemerythrin domain-containing protein [Sporomusa sp.]HWR09402.1 hemerythrin domain-containing protein [Sporomusa sp.]
MADISNLTRQHKEIIELLDKLNNFATPAAVVKDAFAISMLLGQLAGKINIHLSNEDKFLYPRLMDSNDVRTQTVSTQFAQEMGGLASTFGDFKSKYTNSIKISDNAPSFLTELKQITTAIRARTIREETALYPLLAN